MVRTGIAGIGAIAENYIKLVASGKVNGMELTAFSSRNVVHAQEVAEKYGFHNLSIYGDYEEMLASGKVDAVIICTPHYQHPAMGKLAVRHGIHMLVEKPIGVFSEEVKEMIELAEEKPELKSGVLYNRRACCTFHKVKELVEGNAVGSIKRANWLITNLHRTEAYHKSSPWRGTYKGEGGGILMTQASHQLDLFLWICSMPARVRGFCYNGMERDIQVENDVTIQMEFENGATGQFIASSREFPGTNRFEISGDLGQIIVENDNHIIYNKLETSESEYSRTTSDYFGKIPYERFDFYFNDDENEVQHAAILNNFVDAIEKDEEVICPLKEAMNSLVIINGAYLSDWKQKTLDIPFDYSLFTQELKKKF